MEGLQLPVNSLQGVLSTIFAIKAQIKSLVRLIMRCQGVCVGSWRSLNPGFFVSGQISAVCGEGF
jgi:hypothetical protein